MSDSNQIKDPTFLQLKLLSEQFSELHLNDLFDQDNLRFEQLSTQFEQLVFDYSKLSLPQHVMDVLLQFAISKQLKSWIHRLFSDEQINYTEQRAAMHWALRVPKHVQTEINHDVHQQLDRMYQVVEKINAGQYRGYTGEVIRDVVNIGVGGADLGPLMVSHA